MFVLVLAVSPDMQPSESAGTPQAAGIPQKHVNAHASQTDPEKL